MPSMRWRRATPTTSSRSPSVRSGAILSSSGVARAPSAARSRASITRASRSSSAAACCRLRRPGVFGDETLTVRKLDMRRERRDAGHVVGGAIDRVLVGADIDADDAARAARAASRAATAATPSLLKPSRLITAWSASRRNRRGRGLPGCGCGVTPPTSTKPKPSRNSASDTSAFLSKPAARPTGLGNVRPNAARASFASSGAGRGSGASFERAAAPARAPSPDRACAAAARRGGRTGAITARAPGTRGRRPERQRLHPAHRRERQRAVEMREQRAAARGLVAQRGAERRGVDRDQHQIALRRRNAAPRSRRPARRSRNG